MKFFVSPGFSSECLFTKRFVFT